ncbi:hypothetical protein KIPB_007878 [Kipferlia bialata]|uniref:Ubiquitin-like domain-containing protein n=1 Tax=Kipferlia bialata TaxID=797122 RepID=A0A9K3D1L1_9EUKA|nr:hypothetical protein KIPB_007878 [Kipferlia bialata]|eukprot:g7878.t1
MTTAGVPVKDEPVSGGGGGTDQGERPEAEQAPKKIKLQLRDQNDMHSLFIRVFPRGQFRRIFDHFARKADCTLKELRFTIDGERIECHDTPEHHGLKDGDTIDVLRQQIGGADSPCRFK